MIRRFTRHLPSIGFVLIILALAGVGVFVGWISGEDWYDRLGTPMDRETEYSTLAGYADYLESIGCRTQRREAGIRGLQTAIRLRRQIGDEAGVRRARAVLDELTAGQSRKVEIQAADQARSERVRMAGVTQDGWTLDGKPGTLQITNSSPQPLFKYLILSYDFRTPAMPTVVRVIEEAAPRVMKFNGAGFQRLAVPIPGFGVRRIELSTDKHFSIAGDRRARGVHLKLPRSDKMLRIKTRGLTEDGWTKAEGPTRLILENRAGVRKIVNLEIGYFSSNPAMPIIVSIGGLGYERSFVFNGAQKERFFFQVKGKSSTTLHVFCNETFHAVNDDRELGVHLRLKDAHVKNELRMRGFYSDGWSKEGPPARVVIRNLREETIRYSMELMYWDDNAKMPITVTVTGPDGEDETKFVFDRAEARYLDLIVGPGRESVWELQTDKFFTPEQDGRRVGVHVELQKQDSMK